MVPTSPPQNREDVFDPQTLLPTVWLCWCQWQVGNYKDNVSIDKCKSFCLLNLITAVEDSPRSPHDCCRVTLDLYKWSPPTLCTPDPTIPPCLPSSMARPSLWLVSLVSGSPEPKPGPDKGSLRYWSRRILVFEKSCLIYQSVQKVRCIPTAMQGLAACLQ